MNFSNKNIYRVLFVLLITVAPLGKVSFAQTATSLDKIITIIGRNRIILQSDIEIQLAQARQQDPNISDTARCYILQQMIIQKMLLEQAEHDSVEVTEEDVDGQLENRIRYFISVYGSKERLEQVSGKTIGQLKEEYRDVIKEQMLAKKVEDLVMEHVKITPAEVEAFYKKIPVDSLPFFPSTVEVGQIVIDPPVSQEMDDYAHTRMEDLRKQIIEGRITFEAAAGLYSEDPGSRDNGGRIDGVTRNGGFVQEFVQATFKLQNGEISPIVKTKFGYHIIQMVNRKGEEADIRHILIKATVTTADFNKAIHKLDSVRNILLEGKMSFPEAVGKFSTDENANRTGGMISDPQTGNTFLDVAKLDPVMVLLLDSLQEGSYSKPHIFVNDQREKSCRIVFLRVRTGPHKANLKDDYGKIQEVALAQKRQQKMAFWVKSKSPLYYLWIAPEYSICDGMKGWTTTAE